MRAPPPPTFLEFFAGGGMARLGLGPGWRCLFANDIDPKKADAYVRNFGSLEMIRRDVAALRIDDLPGPADLVWGSFPCQDLSLAGDGRGLGARPRRAADAAESRSGAFWPFWRLVSGLRAAGRGPRLVVLENVVGALTASGGRDFTALCRALVEGGYRFGPLILDARDFLPQSRPRLFLVAEDAARPLRRDLVLDQAPDGTAAGLRAAADRLPASVRARLVWWRLPPPEARPLSLEDVLEEDAPEALFDPPETTAALLAAMSARNLAKLEDARRGGLRVGALYRRTRETPEGARVVRTEVRFDLAGCLRTPAGGSSRQKLLLLGPGGVRTRLLSARETARLMGVPDDYRLPRSYSDAYHLTGDGVAVPVVRHLARSLLEPLLRGGDDPAAPLALEAAGASGA